MALLYLATFGSFIGFSAGFAMLSKTQFPDVQIPVSYTHLDVYKRQDTGMRFGLFLELPLGLREREKNGKLKDCHYPT